MLIENPLSESMRARSIVFEGFSKFLEIDLFAL